MDTIFTFASCQKMDCRSILIANDTEQENVESFNITLVNTTHPRIKLKLDQVNGEIEITDNGV